MKQILRHTSFALVILPNLVWADDVPRVPTDTPMSDGFALLRDGAEALMQDLFAELEPALKGFEAFALELEAYQPPIMLPNGDILIRRKTSNDADIGMPAVPVPPIPRQPIKIDPMPDDDIEI
jgi:hypothetical protein